MRIKLISILFVLLFLPFVYAGNICGVSFGTTTPVVKDGSGNVVIESDQSGNILINSSSFTQSSSIPDSLVGYFIVKVSGSSKAAFSHAASYIARTITENSAISSGSNNLLINSTNGYLLKVDNTGQLYSKARVAYQRGQVACSADGSYCRDSETREVRDYYCRVSDGGCPYDTGTVESCPDNWGSWYCSPSAGDNTDKKRDLYNGVCNGPGGSASCGNGNVIDSETQDCGNSETGGSSTYHCGQGGNPGQRWLWRWDTKRGCETSPQVQCYDRQQEVLQHTCDNVWCENPGNGGQIITQTGCPEGGTACSSTTNSCQTCTDTNSDPNVFSSISGNRGCTSASGCNTYNENDYCSGSGKKDFYCSGGQYASRDYTCPGTCEGPTSRDIYTRNTVTDWTATCSGGACGKSAYTDSCVNPNRVSDTYCNGDFADNIDTNCPRTCSDPDGADRYTASTTEHKNGECSNGACGNTQFFSDMCTDSDSVREYYCNNDDLVNQIMDCTASCWDSDGGANAFTSGYVQHRTASCSGGACYTRDWNDYCEDSNTVREYSCSGNTLVGESIDCPSSCSGGRCIGT